MAYVLKTKTGASFTCDLVFADLPKASQDRIIHNGMMTVLRNSYASDKDDAARRKSFDTVVDALKRGTAPARAGRSGDPVGAEARAIARKILAKNGVKVEDETYKDKLARIAGDARVIAQAEKNVAATADLDFDL